MRRAQTDVSVELFSVGVQMWNSGSNDAATERIANEANFRQTIALAMLLDEADNFLRQPLTHDTNLYVHFTLIRTRVHEDGPRLRISDYFLH